MAEENKEDIQQQASDNNSSDAQKKSDNTNNTTDDSQKQDTDSNQNQGTTTTEENGPTHKGWSTYSVSDFSDAIGVRELNGIMGDAAAMKARQHLLNPKKYRSEIKKPNPGKMPNNKDAFPVDLKIEEFETHYPPTRIYEMTVDKHEKNATMAAMAVGMNAEKRIIKLENNLSTLFRLFFRLGARMHINCQYWGGITPFEKYRCIRCLADDRISDGQNVQIDQCLYCTRYEPVYGQCYEIMNDLGANVASILDNNQMAYMNMADYVDLTRTERFHTEREKAKVDLNTVLTRDPNEKDFNDAWGDGIQMDWKYVPKEEQKTHINWRQSINDDGKNLKRLASFPCNEANAGANIVNNSSTDDVYKKNKEAMENYDPAKVKDDDKDKFVKTLIDESKNITGQKDDCLNIYRGTEFNEVKKKCQSESVDPLAVGCIGFVSSSKDYDSIISKLKEIQEKLGTKNPAITIAAYGTSPEAFLGTQGDSDNSSSSGVPRIDKPLTVNSSGSDKDKSSSKDDKKDSGDGITLDWDNRDSWLWTDFAKRFVERAQMVEPQVTQGALELFPKVCYLYCEVLPSCMNSRFDEENMGFPFFDEEFEPGGLNYSSPFGWRESTQSYHRGIDIGANGGTEIHAIHDGTITEDGTGESWGDWHGICLDHGDGTYSRYLHCATMSVKKGDHVTRGQVIATVGGWGANGANTYDTHLHIEISSGDSVTHVPSDTDPCDYWPKFKSAVSVGSPLTIA